MNLREMQEQREHQVLSRYAAFSDQSLGRDRETAPCDIRTVYQRDRDKIIHSKAFRRLNGKTQVFLTPEGDHYRTRLTHTLEVSQTARTIAKALRLNEDLTEAIALGHDLGHTPFGHAGERALNEICPGGFKHYLQSVRVVERLERDGEGLNLTKEVRDGIANHQYSTTPMTLEGKIVRISDKIAYVNHDIDDAIRGHIITEEQIPQEFTSVLGHNLSERLNKLIHDIIINSEEKNEITMSPEVEKAFSGLRSYMFESVYTNPLAKGQEAKAGQMVQELYLYYMSHPDLLPEEYRRMIQEKNEKTERVVCDYVAGMTDRYAVTKFKQIMIPNAWDVV
ncbi:MAG: deoxyguanosinetriphosphate triphosphohydrolase [Lachnospiraceae bacterium]|nr:deoxyguanosinetriphosphate triphosphohydrolase [Lachnospiraceae bacterium]MBP3611230.1 deoxyguanosinetriphosphate triphosphohydrolase [Lachnospiraceae bacterium]